MPRDGEKLLEVQALAMIDDVENRRPGFQRFHAVADRRQVGRGIEERPVLLADDHRRFLLPFGGRRKSAPSLSRAMPRGCNSSTIGAKLIVVETLAQGVVELDVQPAIDPLDLVLRQAGRNSCHSRRFSASPAWSLAVSASTAAGLGIFTVGDRHVAMFHRSMVCRTSR